MNESTAASSTHGLIYSERALGGSHYALVVAPEVVIEWGRPVLDALRVDIGNTARDVEIVAAFERARSQPRVFIFRGADRHNGGRIRFAAALDEAEREELGHLLFQSHLPVLRRLMAAGAQLFVYVDWEPAMLDLFRRVMSQIAQDRVAQAGPSPDPAESRLVKLDQWILTRLTLYCAQPFEDVVTQLLPDSLPLFERREERIARLLEGIPSEALELDVGGAPR